METSKRCVKLFALIFILGVYLLKSKFRIEDKLMAKVYFLVGFLATAVTIATVMDNPSF